MSCQLDDIECTEDKRNSWRQIRTRPGNEWPYNLKSHPPTLFPSSSPLPSPSTPSSLLHCSKASGSTRTCPRRSGSSSPRATPRSASPSSSRTRPSAPPSARPRPPRRPPWPQPSPRRRSSRSCTRSQDVSSLMSAEEEENLGLDLGPYLREAWRPLAVANTVELRASYYTLQHNFARFT